MRSRKRRWRKRILRGSALLLLIALVAGVAYEQTGRRRDRRLLPQVGRSVDIGGRALNIYCEGQGSPAVVLDSGAGAPGYSWAAVQPRVAQFTRVCWYDRAGYGWSDPGPYPRTSEAIARDLHALLRAAGVPGPYVLVGASFGGFDVRVYNALYPEEVAGAVLVDSAHEDESARAPKFLLAAHRPPRALRRPLSLLMQALAQAGVVRLLEGFTLPAPAPQSFTPAQAAYIQGLPRLPNAVVANLNEGLVEEDETIPQVRAAGNFGDRPLVVLTAGRGFTFDDPALAKEAAAYHAVWVNEMQPQLARLSTRGRQMIVAESGHAIQYDAPDAVAQAVRDVVNDVRAGRQSSGVS
jgi:pimeloyl-ACP methyl ester carboxylesterase